MNIFIIGAHRTGKSTLAKEIANYKNMKYQSINLKDAPVWNDYDFSDLTNVGFQTRIDIQRSLFEYYKEQVKDKNNCVFDRSIIDIFAYTSYINPESLSDVRYVEELESDLIKETDKLNLSNDKLILVQPGIKIQEEGSFFYTEYNQFQLNYIMIGILYSYIKSNNFHLLSSRDLDVRIKDCLHFLS